MSAPAWIIWLGAHFSPEQYLFWTRWQCLVWTLADVSIVLSLILLSNMARLWLQRRPHRFSYAVLGFTVLLIPFAVSAPTGGMLFLVEVAITVPHFLLLAYLLVANVRVYAAFLYGIIEHSRNLDED